MVEADDKIELDYMNLGADVREMVDWTNPPTVANLREDFNQALPSHTDHVNRVNKWLSSLKGELTNVVIQQGRSKVQPKLIRKQNEWRYAGIEEPFLSTDDLFKVEPVTHLDVEAARQNQLILNKQFRVDIPRVKLINKYVRDAVNKGTVVFKVAWEEQTGIVREEQMVPIFAESLEQFMEVAQMMIEQEMMTEEDAIELVQSGQWMEVPIGEEPEVNEVLKTYINRPVVEIRDSRNVIIDPSCEGDVGKAQFIIDKFTTDLSTLLKDERYNKKQLGKIQSREYDSRENHDYNDESSQTRDFKFQDKPRQKLVAYEYWGYWDIHKNGIVVPIVATWIGDIMIRLEENPYPDKKLPFVLVQYLPPEEETVYGDADASLLEDNQNIVGAVTRGVIDLIGRSANAQTLIRKDLFDPINADRFKKGLDAEVNPVNDIEKSIIQTKMPEIPRSALELIQMIHNETESITGVKAFSQGVTSQALGDSVGGIRSALDATAKRELSILRRLSDGLKEVGRKIISMNAHWLDDEEVIRITDDEFVAIKRDDLAGNFDLVLNVSTAEADNQKAAELAFMLQTIGPAVPFDITKILMVKIAELRKLPDLAFALKQFEPQPDPLDQAKKMAEIEYLLANSKKDESAVGKNKADEILKLAKAGQAHAQARNIESDSDKKDLDYLEQATGLSHDRELESIQRKEEAKAQNKVDKKV